MKSRISASARPEKRRGALPFPVRPSSSCIFRLSAALGVCFTLAAQLSTQAADILRGGGVSAGTRPGAAGNSNDSPAAAMAAARANAKDALARTSNALQSVRAMQAAARNLAVKGPNNLGKDPNHTGLQLPNIPNGLVTGGLQVAPGVPVDLAHPTSGENPALWQGAKLPVQTTASSGRVEVTIDQTRPQALLNWETFNIGKQTTLTFDQSGGGDNQSQWIAFNKINDPTGVPSQILGSIEAPGQVYVINQNGIIFGGSSQLNLHTLVASSLPINDNLITRGLLNNPDVQFLFSSLPLSAGAKGTPAFTPPPAPLGYSGDVTVQPGAVIASPTSPEHVGGKVALIGPNVSNAGTISTPDGQTILAAGEQVGFAAHASSDPHLRGLDVYVGQGGGTATNAEGGLIEAPRADVTVIAKDVRQLGVIESSTSVSLNGRIDLLADYGAVGNSEFNPSDESLKPFLFKTTGTVTLGPNSVTAILPELSSTETVVGTELALHSQVVVQGKVIHLAPDAELLAPNADVALSAGTWNFQSPLSNFALTTGQIYLDAGAEINVAGSLDVGVPVSQNIVSAQLLGTELADSPAQRFGPFRGATIQIDLRQSGVYNGRTWIGTPLADVSGYVGLIQRSVGELTTAGGTVKLGAGESVVMQSGSTVDVSGGWIDYQGGMVQTSRVVSGGHIFDISQATPDRVYGGFSTGIFFDTHLKWNLTEAFTAPLVANGAHFEEGYAYGGSGGSVSISAPSMALDGRLQGQTVAGPRQRDVAPAPGTLSIAFQKQDASTPALLPFSPTPPAVVFRDNSSLAPADAFALDGSGNPLPLRADRVAEVVLSPDLLGSSGFMALQVDNSDGAIRVPANVELTAAAGGSISLAGANLDIQGHVSAPGGTLSFGAFDVSPFAVPQLLTTPDPDPTRGHFILGSSGVLSTTGLIIDDRQTAANPNTLPLVYSGGKVTINAYSADFEEGSLIDVSGGVVLSPTAKRTYGDGGRITINSGRDPNVPKLIGGRLNLDAELVGFSGGKGGSLSLLAPAIQIGGQAANAGTLQLAPEFFSQGGFNSFALSGIGAAAAAPGKYVPGVYIAPGAIVAPVVQSFVADPSATGDPGISLDVTVLPQGLRNPVNLSFTAVGARNDNNLVAIRGDFVMGRGAVIQTDPRATVTVGGETATVLGSIIAPGGSIAVSGGKESSILFGNEQGALPTVDLGPHSVLSTAGTTLLTPDPRGYHTGVVLPGGTISVSGNIVAEAGSLLDVSGASDVLDLLPVYSSQTAALNNTISLSALVPTTIDSSGGLIDLRGGQELFTDARLVGTAGGPAAFGGSLLVSSGRFYNPTSGAPPSPLDVTLQVTQGGAAIPVPFHAPGTRAIGKPVLGADGNPAGSFGHFAADDFNAGGFDSLTLKGTVQFAGPVSIAANRSISVADSGVLFADSGVTLRAPYVALGQAFQTPQQPEQLQPPFLVANQPFHIFPANGPGQLTVIASLIDLGNLTLQGVGKATFIADQGDIRGNGTLDIAGDLYFRAGQVYPTSASFFNIVAYDYQFNGVTRPGTVTFAASGTRLLPLSAGGELDVYGSVIVQGGVLRAPLGAINLGWDGTGTGPKDPITGLTVAPTQRLTLSKGSVTSVSAIDPVTGEPVLIPYGINLNGTSWIDPTGADITVGGVPGKAINLAAARIDDQAGATIDIRGGGELYAYRWVKGVGGSTDILASSSGFAIIPGYGADYAPYAPFNSNRPADSDIATNLGTDPGYVDGRLAVGDRVYLGASDGLAAGTYTLLPARYALLPGAFLVTPQSGIPLESVTTPDGSALVSGYRYNDLSSARTGTPLFSRFEVASASVIRNRAEYADSLANSFLRQSALDHNVAPPRLPLDSGQLVLAATQAMAVQGTVTSHSIAGGRGGLVDISSPVDILIAGPGVAGGPGMLVLDSRQLSAIGAESLLIGGVRQIGADGTTVSVQTGNLTVDNAGSPLSGNDLILVANKDLTLAAGAVVQQRGASSGQADTLLLGKSNVPGSGDGALLRVSSDPTAQIVRAGVSSSTVPTVTIGAGASLSGASLILDSTSAMNLDPSARLDGTAISLNSGQVSLQLDNPGALLPTTGLVLSGTALQTLQAGTRSLSLLSYSSIDIYGTGQVGQPSVASLELHAAEIRGFNNGGGSVHFVAQNVLLDNSAGGHTPGPVGGNSGGTLAFDAGTIRLGANTLAIDQFANVALNASDAIVARGVGGVGVQGSLAMSTPLITGLAGATQAITAGGALSADAPAGGPGKAIAAGLGASLTLAGGSVAVNTDIVLPSGSLTLHATNGDVLIGNLAASRLEVGGTAQHFFDLTKYTDGGQISIMSDHGSVNVAAGSLVTVAAQTGGGDAGGLSVDTRQGSFTVADGTLNGSGGKGGSFTLDVGSLPSTQALDAALNDAGFTLARSIRVRTGSVDVDGLATAHQYTLSADHGAISVTGTIDASGARGGTIELAAQGSVTLASGAELTVAAQQFNAAGKGGAVALEAGADINGAINPNAVLDLQAGSSVDLSVAAYLPSSAAAGDFTGTLHLRAPQNAAGTDLQLNAINGTILNASAIIAEGYHLFDLTSSGGAITSAVQSTVKVNGTAFGGSSTAISNRLLAGNAGLAPVLTIEAGAEIISRIGDLTLGTLSSTSTSDWDLSSYRYGPNNAPGVLTMRAAGNLVFYNALTDGFASNAYTAQLLSQNPLLPANAQSWSYHLTAGADLSAADAHRVVPLSVLPAASGSLLLGKNGGTNIAPTRGGNAQTSAAVANRFQVIRTGTGDIDISAGRDVQLLNQFATIYTAGTKVADPTLNGTFDLPILSVQSQGALGAIQQNPFYAAQYTFGGGNVSIVAQNDITHLTRNSAGSLIADSERELPVNWLYRRGYLDPVTGQFGIVKNGDVGSTTWWVDFSNFFEGVGALGGGNVTMIAGHDVSNVDGLVPTNARMPKGQPDAAKLVELGGGDLLVSAGHNIDGGVYYVERGHGTLRAGSEITTNATRSPSLTILAVPSAVFPQQTWLPTTLFAGKASFDVSARGDLLLGPVANPFLLPEGLNNTYWYKSYFSTYATSDEINVSSLQGAVTMRLAATLPGASSASPMLENWFDRELLFTLTHTESAAAFQPWLRLDETSLTPFAGSLSFAGVGNLLPGTLRITSFSKDINLIGSLTLSPSPTGTIDLAAAGSINALRINGITTLNGVSVSSWSSGSVNLSDADPNAVPGIASPLSLSAPFPTGVGTAPWATTDSHVLDNVNRLFAESGSTTGEFGVIQTKQALHDASILHAGDPDPIHLYAETGNISDLTLFSGKFARIIAGNDLTAVGLYVQNTGASDTTVVAAGRDIIAFDPNSPFRVAAQLPGNIVDAPPTGDIQITGPGTLEVLAGRNFDLGIGPNNSNGTGVGLTSIGNFRNPSLPFNGANVILGAGIGAATSLAQGRLDFKAFADQFLQPGSLNATRYLPTLGTLIGTPGGGEAEIWDAYNKLADEQQASFALDIFYLVLRDAGRDHNVPGSPGFGTYAAGFSAISALFPGSDWQGDISLTSREIKTRSGGDISLIAPGGGLVVGFDVPGNQASDQGILTEHGGNISIFTDDSVTVGTSRIFTLRGGNELIWSSTGNIAAGASSKTVQSAPPTRVVIDPQSGDVATDLAGLATGGGIGVLATIVGVPPGDVDLIAPAGTIDAGDAGIRVSGNINIAAVQVLNASNIQAGGASNGVPSAPPSAPSISAISPNNTAAANNNASSEEAARQSRQQAAPQEEPPSIITVEVLGFGGGEGGSDDEEERRRKAAESGETQASAAPIGKAPLLRPAEASLRIADRRVQSRPRELIQKWRRSLNRLA